MARTIIHIGMPRTASTFLQRELFPNVRGFEFYGVDDTQYNPVFQKLLYQDDSVFNEAEAEKSLLPYTTKNSILSNELFVGQSLYLQSTNRSRTARRLKRFFPDAEILLVLRNQADLLKSLYAIGVYAGMTKKPEAFVKFWDDRSQVDAPLYATFDDCENTEAYFFYPLVKLYKSLFEKVHVVLFEDFKSNPVTFAERLSHILNFSETVTLKNEGKKVNKSLTIRQLKLIRRLNSYKPAMNRTSFGSKVFRFHLRFIEHNMKGKKPFAFDEELHQKIKIAFESDNRKLLEIVPELVDNKVFNENYL